MSKNHLIFTGIGFELVGIMLACMSLGSYLDKSMGWRGLGTALLMFAGLLGWMVHLVILMKRFNKEGEKQ